MATLPAPNKKPKKESDKRKMLQRRVQETKQELDHSLQDLKRDAITTAVGMASAYVGYRVVRWLLGGGKKKEKQKKTKQTEIRYVQVEAPKKSNGLLGMIINRASSIVLDIILDTVQDNLPSRNKKDK
jgi:hypothetical protein